MTTRRNYSCNLCGEAIGEATNPEPYNAGLGITWTTVGMTDVLCCQAENHLCLECIRGVQKISIEPDAELRKT